MAVERQDLFPTRRTSDTPGFDVGNIAALVAALRRHWWIQQTRPLLGTSRKEGVEVGGGEGEGSRGVG